MTDILGFTWLLLVVVGAALSMSLPGFRRIAAFGKYRNDPSNICYERAIDKDVCGVSSPDDRP